MKMVNKLEENMHMLHIPTVASSPLYSEDTGELVYDENMKSYLGVQHNYLYIVIDNNEPFKKGDWIIEKGYILNEYPDYLTDLDECQLVIASNDPNIGLPQISDELINWYCENFNKENGFI